MTKTHFVYVDGSALRDGRIAIGIYNRTTQDKFSLSLNQRGNNITAELLAVKFCLKIMRSNGVSRLIILCDCETVVNYVNGKYNPRKLKAKYRRILDSIRVLMKGFECAQTVLIYRQENTTADALAKKANGIQYALDRYASSPSGDANDIIGDW